MVGPCRWGVRFPGGLFLHCVFGGPLHQTFNVQFDVVQSVLIPSIWNDFLFLRGVCLCFHLQLLCVCILYISYRGTETILLVFLGKHNPFVFKLLIPFMKNIFYAEKSSLKTFRWVKWFKKSNNLKFSYQSFHLFSSVNLLLDKEECTADTRKNIYITRQCFVWCTKCRGNPFVNSDLMDIVWWQTLTVSRSLKVLLLHPLPWENIVDGMIWREKWEKKNRKKIPFQEMLRTYNNIQYDCFGGLLLLSTCKMNYVKIYSYYSYTYYSIQ